MVASKKNVVVIGGGTGLPVLLEGLKKYPIHLTALVTVADDGGSSGDLRKLLNIPAPGDIRNVITALSEADEQFIQLFQHRFKTNNGLSDHSIGNFLLAALTEIKGSFSEGIRELSRVFQVKGNILPMTNESISLIAEMEDGSVVSGESNIPLAKKKIKRLRLGPGPVVPVAEVIEAIEEADFVIISPGSLYTSIMPNLIIPQINEAFKGTSAQFIYVCNIMTQEGETSDYKASDHVKAIHKHIGKNLIDIMILNNGLIKKEVIKKYEQENAHVVMNDLEELGKLNVRIIQEDIVNYFKGMVRHNTEKIAKLIYQLMGP